jgi:aspartate/tyrosine/aromatic aminotransferase
MFADLAALPPDALLGITRMFKEDARATKVDLGVGVFKTAANETPVLRAVKSAQARLVASEKTKVYLPPDGAPGFADAVRALIFGPKADAGRIGVVQTPGGCGALRVGADLLKRAGAERVLVTDPTWANHRPLLGAAGLSIEPASYYDRATGRLKIDDYLNAAGKLGPRDALLAHACCHNPAGVDLARDEIDAVVDIAAKRGFLLFIDMAYQGFGEGLDADAYFARAAAERLPEALVAYSCSKNFGLYRERAGALCVIGKDQAHAEALKSHALNIARQIYSMAPAHGGLLVSEILRDPALAADWRAEVDEMRAALLASRAMLADALAERQLGERYQRLRNERGMFSLLPLEPVQVAAAREKFGVYMAGDGRINLCGVNLGNVAHVADAIAAIARG